MKREPRVGKTLETKVIETVTEIGTETADRETEAIEETITTKIHREMKATIAKQWLLGIAIGLSMVSCDTSRVFERNDDFENRVWAAEDTHTFLFTIDDTQADYEVMLNVRNSLIYPYQNLYTTISIEDSTGAEIYQTLKNTSLFDEKTGEPLGSGLGDIFDHQSLVVTNFRFPYEGTYTAFVTQSMRMDSLPEIMSVGIRVAKVEK